MSNTNFYLLLDRVNIKRANAISSPITYGFPSITGFLGAVHALNRKLVEEQNILLDGVLVSCHDYNIHTYRSNQNYTFIQSRNPIKKNGGSASIIEEGKIDITVSLMIEVKLDIELEEWFEDKENQQLFINKIKKMVCQQRFAGGFVAEISNVKLYDYYNTEVDVLKRELLPGFILCEAKKELNEITKQLQTENPKATPLDALIELSTLHRIPDSIEKVKNKNTNWRYENIKTGRGWLVPIPVGFQAIDEVIEKGNLKNSRTNEYPAQYVESLYSLGKWIFPHRIKNIEDCFWRYKTIENKFYLATQSNN
jgi:CRISPR-associated protein Csy2